MNRLTLARRTQIVATLVEGNSLRATARLTDTALYAFAFFWLASCLPYPAHAQQPGTLGPQPTLFYSRNGRTPVQLFDGGTAARDAANARRNLGIPWRDGADSLTAAWTLSGSLIAPWTYLRDSLTTFQAFGDTTKRLKLELGKLRTNTLHLWLPDTTVGACNVPCLQSNQTWTGLNTYTGTISANGSGANVLLGGQGTVQIGNSGGNGGTDLATLATAGLPPIATFQSFSGTVAYLSDVQSNSGAAVYDPLLRVKDSQFFVKDDGDTTRKFQWQASGISSGTTRTYTVLDMSGTAPLWEANNTWTGSNVFSDGQITINNSGSSSILHHNGSDADDYFPGTSGSVLIHGATQPVGSKTLYTTNTINARDDRFTLKASGDTTKTLIHDLSQLTAARRDTFPDTPGYFVIRRNARDFTAQSANISATNIATSPPAGMYRVTVYGVTTGLLGAGVTVTIGWTDPQQAQTATAFTLGTALGAESSTTVPIEVASGSVTVTTSGYLTGSYSLYCRVEGPL